MMKKWTLCLPFLLLGCRAVGPVYVPPKPKLPAHYCAEGGTAAMPPKWWEVFKDGVLDTLMARTLDHHPDVEMAQARLTQARIQQVIQAGHGECRSGVAASVARDRLSRHGEMMANIPSQKGLQTDFTHHQIAFDASWEIDLFGHRHHLGEAAEARADASAERLRDVRVVLCAEVAKQYITYRYAQHRIALCEKQVKAQQELVRLAGLRVKVGEALPAESVRSEMALDLAEATLADLRLVRRQSLVALSTLTTMPLDSLEAKLGEASPLRIPEAPSAGLPSDLLKQRPDVRAAEREMAAACAEIGVAVADRYPRFSLVGNGGWSSVQASTLLDKASLMWSVGPKLYLPFFDGGRLKNQVKASEAAYEAVVAAYQKAVWAALSDVEQALDRLAAMEVRRSRFESIESRQAQLARYSHIQWQSGELAKMDWLEAEKLLYQQQDQTLQAQSQSLLALVSLCKALGGGW